jgi:hypothetical protein
MLRFPIRGITMNDISSIAKQLGSRGGSSTLKKYGKDHFKKISLLAAKSRQDKAKKSTY